MCWATGNGVPYCLLSCRDTPQDGVKGAQWLATEVTAISLVTGLEGPKARASGV